MPRGDNQLQILDLAEPVHGIEILIDRSAAGGDKYTVWVNVDGLCRFRCTMIDLEFLRLEDKRPAQYRRR